MVDVIVLLGGIFLFGWGIATILYPRKTPYVAGASGYKHDMTRGNVVLQRSMGVVMIGLGVAIAWMGV